MTASAEPLATPSRGADRVSLLPGERELLLRLLDLRTAGPLETGPRGPVPRLWEAGRLYAEAAERIGMSVLRHGPPGPEALERCAVPAVVRAGARAPGFLDCQPSLLLGLGPGLPPGSGAGPPRLPRRATVMCNVHLDTVAGWWPARFDGRRFHGRGAIDAKGPAVALLAGVRAAVEQEPAIGQRTAVLVQAVAGEEGGAVGVFGTRPLVAAGHVGALNLFCEPTGLRYLPRATAAMTACLRVIGQDAVDDAPGAGHNATALLGYLAQHLARVLPPRLSGRGRMCLAGLHTGDGHNRVYGSGRLLLNFAYGSSADARRIESELERAVHGGLEAFRADFAGLPDFARTRADAASITRLDWLKRGLPALEPADPAAGHTRWAEEILRQAGVPRAPDRQPAFTCDAIWTANIPDAFTAVYGPGLLDANRAHAEGEFADLADLERFAAGIARLLLSHARTVTVPGGPRTGG